MRPGGETARPDRADHLSDLDSGAGAHAGYDRLEMRIRALDSRSVVDSHVAARTPFPSGVEHSAGGDRANGRSHRCREIDAEMRPVRAEERMEPRRGERRSDARELNGIAEKGAAERLTLGGVVVAAVVVGLEVNRVPALPAHIELGGDDVAAVEAPVGISPLLVGDSEAVSRLDVGVEVDLPAEDIDESRYDGVRPPAFRSGGVQAGFDRPADDAHSGHSGQPLDLRGDLFGWEI